MKKLWLGCAAVVLGAAVLSTPVRGDTKEVFELNTTIFGVTQWAAFTNPAIQKVQILDVDLINLGLGNPLGTAVPNNLHLALAADCVGSNMEMIVWDSAPPGGSNLVTLADLRAVSIIEGVKHHQHSRDLISQVTFHFAGSESNGFAGGVCFASGTVATIRTNDCVGKYTANLVGVLANSFFFTNTVYTNIIDFTVTNVTTNVDLVVSNLTVNISNTKMSTGARLGTLIEP